ncbi:MAG TPA: SGNH/GDSL hydrolase family protein [Candidatus Nitrosotenuis sp.]|nr:SGNH/GDSL hydrolase family protein [Candidatus Nitrosotenuis sp.]
MDTWRLGQLVLALLFAGNMSLALHFLLKSRRPRDEGFRGRLLRALGVATFFLLQAEILLRLAQGSSPPPDLPVHLEGDRAGLTFRVQNGAGPYCMVTLARESEPAGQAGLPTRRPGDFLILCLGDSVTYGVGAGYQESYPFLLQKALQRRHPERRIMVVNASFPGATSLHGAYLLEQLSGVLQPDLIIEGFLYNDSYAPFPWSYRSRSGRVAQIKRLLARSRLYREMCYHIVLWASRSLPDRPGSGGPAAVQNYRENLEALADLAQGQKAALIFLSPPYNKAYRMPPGSRMSLEALLEGLRAASFRQALRDVARERGGVYLDAYAYFEGLPAAEHERLFADFLHLKAQGNQRLANLLVEEIEAAGLIPPRRTAPDQGSRAIKLSRPG